MKTEVTDRVSRMRCDACGKRMMGRATRPYEEDVSHDGRPPVRVRIPDVSVIACLNPECPTDRPEKSVILDDAALEQITDETFRQLGLLTPREIREQREKLGLTQQALQEMLGLGGNALSRYENARLYQ